LEKSEERCGGIEHGRRSITGVMQAGVQAIMNISSTPRIKHELAGINIALVAEWQAEHKEKASL